MGRPDEVLNPGSYRWAADLFAVVGYWVLDVGLLTVLGVWYWLMGCWDAVGLLDSWM